MATKNQKTSLSMMGNRNAEKWTFKKAIQLFNKAIELTGEKETTTIKEGKKVIEVEAYKFDFIGEIAGEFGTFKEIFSHLTARFPVLKRKHKTLISNLERNCYYNTKKGNIKEATGIVNLKSNHKWTDRQENNVNVNSIDETKKALAAFRKSINDEYSKE